MLCGIIKSNWIVSKNICSSPLISFFFLFSLWLHGPGAPETKTILFKDSQVLWIEHYIVVIG